MKYKAKKLSAFLATIIFSLSALTSFTASADNSAYETGRIVYSSADELPCDSELLTGYFENKLYEANIFYTNEAVSYSAFGTARLNSAELEIYNAAKAHITKIAAGNESSTTVVIPSVKFTFEQLGIAQGASDSEVKQAIYEMYAKLCKYMLYDFPYELYWHDKTKGTSYGYYKTTDDSGVTITNLTMKFHPGTDYVGNEDFTVDTAKTAAASAAAEKAADIVAEHSGKSDIEKLTAYKEAICDLVTYDYTAADSGTSASGIDPWQVIHVFDGDDTTNVVCEGYAKAFYYLCQLSDFSGYIDCWTVSGFMNGGAHMWNVVAIGSKNYLVDVTNCDEGSVGHPDNLFLIGADGSVAGGYSKTISGQKITFTYRDEIITYMGKSILTLSDVDYSSELDDSGEYNPGNGNNEDADDENNENDDDEGIVIWANGKKEYKNAEIKSSISATNWTNNKGKTQKGKLVWISMLTGTPTLDSTKHKVTTKSDKTVVTVSNKGKITAKAGGTALVYATDTGALESKMFKVTVKNAPTAVFLFGEPDKTASDKKDKLKTVNVIAGGEADRVYIVPFAKKGEVSDDCTYTVTAKKNESGIINFTEVKKDENGKLYFDVKGNKLEKPGKVSKVSVTVTCDQSGKKASVNVQVSAPVSSAECTVSGGNSVIAEKGDTLTLDTKLTISGTSSATTDKLQAVVAESAPSVDSTGKKVTVQKSKQLSVKLDKNTFDITLKASKPVTEAAGVYIITTDSVTKIKTVYKIADISADGKVTTE